MKQETRQKQEELLQEAQTQAETLKEEARQAGHEEGVSAGREEGAAQIRQEQQQILLDANAKAEQTLDAARAEMEAYVQQAEKQIVTIAMSATSSSTSAAPVKAAQSPIRESAKASASGQQDTKDSSFSNVLDKTQQDKVSPDKPEQDKPEAKDALEGAKDPLSQAIAAAVVQQNGAKQTGDTKAAASENPVTDSLAARVLADGQGKAQLTSAAMEMNPGKKDNLTDNKLNPLAETKILDTTLQILRTVKIDELDAAKQDELKQKIKADVNKVLGEGSVYDVYITSFVLQ